MRDAFFAELKDLAACDERIWALTADLGIGLFDGLPRFLNVGIAEQNLIGVAAGLAYGGKVPFAYSIAPFLVSRPHDQLRVDVAMTRANVKLVGVGGGVAYGYLGPTHHAIEDLALTRALPGLTIFTPADPAEARRATRAALAHEGPVYLRLGKNGEPALLPQGAPFGGALTLREGGDVTLASCGPILSETLAAAELLAADGIEATVVHYGTLKPFDAGPLLAERPVVTVEEHSIVGGLGSAAAEALAEAGAPARLVRLGLRDVFAHEVGSREHILRAHGLDADGIAAAAARTLEPARA
jgi:transketolase